MFGNGFGINLIGDFKGCIGLSVTTRAIARLFQETGVPFSITDVPYAWGFSKDESVLAGPIASTVNSMHHPINLYVFPVVLLEVLFQKNPALLRSDRLHIANVWWEASRFPTVFADTLSHFDAILALSDFVANICRNQLPMMPTVLGQHPLYLPSGIGSDRDAFGLSSEELVFVASLDPNSGPERKNPAALIDAFRCAFPDSDQNVRLLIHLNNGTTPLGIRTSERLAHLAQPDPRIRLLLETLDYRQVLSLYASSDVYLSFHRGEGLGLGLLEAMALGKTVIATGWSGNLSFMNQHNSVLLRYRLIPVSGHHKWYHRDVIGADARWADPVAEDAVSWMRKLRSNPGLRAEFGDKARLAAAEYLRRAAEASWIDELESLWRSRNKL